MSDIIPEEHQARAISLQGATWGVCVIIGPSLGGFLARPAVAYPTIFAADSFLGHFPYLLPMCVPAVMCVAGLVSLSLIEEPPRPHWKQQNNEGQDGGDDSAETEGLLAPEDGGEGGKKQETAKASPRLWDFCVGAVPRLMLIYYLVDMVLEFMDGVLFPLWASAPTSAGGLGFSSADIGTVLAATGAAVIVGQVLIYPPLHARVGTVSILRWLPVLQLPCYLAMALTPTVASVVGVRWVWWVGALVSRLRAVLAEMVFSAMSLALNYAVPASQRGAYNGFSQAVSGVGKMLGPSVGAPLYAWSITNGMPALPFGRFFMMEFLSATLLALSGLSLLMPESLNRPAEEGPRR